MLRAYSWGLDVAGSLTATGGVGALLEITNFNSNYYLRPIPLVEIQALASQQVPEGVVGSDQLLQLAAGHRRDTDTEVMVA